MAKEHANLRGEPTAQIETDSVDEFGLTESEPIPADLVGPASVVELRLSPLVTAMWLAAPTVMLLAAWFLSTGPGREVSLGGSLALPETCTLHARFGVDCPGCGLTRGFIQIMHGDPLAALRLNPASWPVFGFVCLQLPLACIHAFGLRRPWVKTWTQANEKLLIAVLLLLVAQWIVRLAMGDLTSPG